MVGTTLSEAGLFYVGILLPSITDLADLLVQMTDFEIPVNGGEQSVCMSLFLKIQKGMRTSFMSTMIWITVYDNENVKLDIEESMFHVY